MVAFVMMRGIFKGFRVEGGGSFCHDERNIADATLRSAWFADVCSFDCAKHHSLDLLDHLRGLLCCGLG